ncbi:MAG: glycosyltransferase family 1 protein [Oscillatoriales cyanobacterium]|nr:MAG: glycosyltransferase family 1 protein [Oscillatoriales cyanobacterium]TAH23672.1 MAG: glycosyltransferase family 1 protein [Oscillatoriales cyanobacterium]
MIEKKLKVLLIIEQCNPEMASVPLEGYNYFKAINKLVDATLVTHVRNKLALEKLNQYNNVFYINESELTRKYYPLMASLTLKGRNNWPLANTLGYPIYAEFNHKVYQQFKEQIQRGDYDLVHALTPMMPRYPVKAVKACKQTPFLLGPVNGGVPFPPGFQEVAKQEFAYLNFLRAVGRALVPGYVETYKKADKVLAGSTYTLNLLKKLFSISDQKIELFYENGISQDFLMSAKSPKKEGDLINLLFVGRLVPYKCPDILLESIGKLEPAIQSKIRLTIVGDGSEKNSLENRVKELNLGEIVSFAGWVNQQETLDYYRKADIFCFPSVREFGGAVVIEAMACGLPCIVANNGGIGEYVTEETGFKIEPNSREYLTQELTKKIKILVEDDKLRESMSAKAIERAKEFEWDKKAENIVEIYQKMLSEKAVCTSP